MVSFTYTVKAPEGLHMRPAGTMAKELGGMACSVTVRCGARCADAKSILGLMAMAVKRGETVTVEVSGQDEEQTAAYLTRFFAEKF